MHAISVSDEMIVANVEWLVTGKIPNGKFTGI